MDKAEDDPESVAVLDGHRARAGRAGAGSRPAARAASSTGPSDGPRRLQLKLRRASGAELPGELRRRLFRVRPRREHQQQGAARGGAGSTSRARSARRAPICRPAHVRGRPGHAARSRRDPERDRADHTPAGDQRGDDHAPGQQGPGSGLPIPLSPRARCPSAPAAPRARAPPASAGRAPRRPGPTRPTSSTTRRAPTPSRAP